MVAFIDWCLVIHYSQCILGKAAWRLCVFNGLRGSQYAYAMVPRSKLKRFMVCVEPRGMDRGGCVLCRYWCLRG